MKKKMNGFRGLFILFVTLAILSFFSLFLVSCEKDHTTPEPVGKPTISMKVVDTTFNNDSTAADLTVKYYSNALIGVIPEGYYGGYLPSTGTFRYEVPVGVGTPIVITAVNSEDPAVFLIDTLWVNILKPTYSLPTISFGAIQILPYGGGTIKIVSEFTNGILSINGTEYDKSPIELTFSLTETTTYHFKVVGLGGVIEDSLTIYVYVPTEWEKNISLAPWKLVHSHESYVGQDGPWTDTDVDWSVPCLADDRKIFKLSPTKEFISDWHTLCQGGVDNPSWHPWSISGNVLIGLSPERTIESVTQDTLCWIYYNPEYIWDPQRNIFLETPRWVKEFYVHPIGE